MHNPQFFCKLASFFMDLVQILVDHETLSTFSYRMHLVVQIFHQFNYLGVTQVFKVCCKVYLDHLWLLNQSHNLYITSQGPSSSSVKWPSLDYHTLCGMWPLLWTLPTPNAFCIVDSNQELSPPVIKDHNFKFYD